MRVYRYFTFAVLIFLLAALLPLACATSGASQSRKAADRELSQYSQPGWKNVKIVGGGMIPGIIFSTAQKDLAYVRTDMGGAYRWNPANESWIPLTDFAGVEDYGRLGISSIATDPVEPNRVIIASGTYTNDWDGTLSQMLVSEDYGDTFTRVDMPFKMGGNMPDRGTGERLAIDPNNNKIAYFGSNGFGLWRSLDYGHSWEEVKSFPTKGNIYDNDFAEYSWCNSCNTIFKECIHKTNPGGHKHFYGIMWVIFDPTSGTKGNNSQNIYVGVADTRHTIYESNDAGETWRPLEVHGGPNDIRNIFQETLHGHLMENCPCNKFYPRTAINSPDGSFITSWHHGFNPYSASWQGGAIMKFTFETRTWEDISLPVSERYNPSEHRSSSRGVGAVSVDWQNPNVLVASTLNNWWPDEEIYRSTNGGKTWDSIWYLDGWPDRVNKYIMDISMAPWLDWGEQKELPEQNPKLGWCIATIVIDPFNSNRMMWGTGATIYGTNNLTEWDKNRRIRIEVMAEGIEECAILELVAPTEGPHLYSGMGDIGGFVHTNLNRAPNMIVNPKIDGVNSIDYAANNPRYVVRIGGDEVWTPDGGIKRTLLGISNDFGRTWKPAETMVLGTQGGWSGLVALSADGRIIVWSDRNVGTYWTNNEGRNWTASTGLPNDVMLVSDRVNPNKFYAFGKNTNGIASSWESTDGGRSFTLTNGNIFSGDVDGRVWSHEHKNFRAVIGMEGHLWLAADKAGLFHSMNGGRTWEKLEGFNCDPGCNCEEGKHNQIPIIGLGKAAPGANYQALYTNAKLNGQWGVYRSDDKGQNWIRINDDTKQFGAANSAITGCPRTYGRVYLATNGRGIQYRDLD